MEDRSASWVAVAFGGMALGGFWFARLEKAAPSLRVTAQWIPGGDYGLDADAVAAFRLETKGALHEAQMDGRTVEYRIVDRQGEGYGLLPMMDPLEPNALKLVRGYPKDLDAPRIVAYVGGVPVASAAVSPLPKVRSVSLVADPRAPLFLETQGGDDLLAKTAQPLPKNEVWRVRAIRTPFTGVDSLTEVGASQSWNQGNRLHIPYGRQIRNVEVEVVRYRLKPRIEVVAIPGVRLMRRLGGTATVVASARVIPSRYGAKIRLPEQATGTRRKSSDGDSRIAVVNLSVMPPIRESDGPSGIQGMRGPKVEILSPAPASLGLRELRLGGAVLRTKVPLTQPLREGLFTIKARLVFYEPMEQDRFRIVVPVKIAPDSQEGAPDYREFRMRNPRSAVEMLAH